MWSGPRNVSTAMMYSFAQRSDTQVVDEPLYGHYLRVSDAEHPGQEEIIASMISDGERVVQEVIFGPCDKPVFFIKNMPHHLINLDWSFLKKLTNILLIRSPEEMLPSLAKNIPNPILRDTGYDAQVKLVELATEWGQVIPIIDSKELLLNPRRVLSILCEQLDIPFEESMLQWEAGARPEDGIWAKFWYHSLHKSTGFAAYKKKTDPFPENLVPLLEESQPYYDILYARAIKAE